MPKSHLTTLVGTIAVVTATIVGGCGDGVSTDPVGPERASTEITSSDAADQVRALAAGRGISPLPPPPAVRPALVELGRVLMFDPLLSGNRDIACMTCHAPRFAMGDARRLPIGQGGTGLGPARSHPGGHFIPRNAPPLFNLYAMRSFFWDGKIAADAKGRFRTSMASGSRTTWRASSSSERCPPWDCSPFFPGPRCAARRAMSWRRSRTANPRGSGAPSCAGSATWRSIGSSLKVPTRERLSSG